jgi:CRP-like cAMP-binding protein
MQGSHTGVSEDSDSAARIRAELASLGVDADILPVLEMTVPGTRPANFRSGETLYREGAEIDVLYVIRCGKIKLLSYLPDGRARIVRLHKRGSVIGLNGLLGEPYEHTAIAVDEVNAYQVPMEVLRPLRERDPLAYSCLLEQWSSYLSYADTWITEFSTGPIRARVARLVQFLAELDDESGPHEAALLSGEEMAEVLGVTPESVSRVIADFKRHRILVEKPDSDVERYLCDMELLAAEGDH